MEAKEICELWDKLDGERSTFKTHWQECAEFVLPQKANVTVTRTPGQKLGQQIYDSTAAHSNELLAGALHGMLTNPASRFFDLRTGEEEIDSDVTVRRFLDQAADIMITTFNNSNFQTEVHENYLDLTTFGTCGLTMEEDDDVYILFSSRPIQELCVRENSKGQIDTVLRMFQYDARQIVQEFGDKGLPEDVKSKLEAGSTDKFDIIHAVYPRDMKGLSEEQQKAPKGYPIGSKYVLKEKKHELKEGGFKEMPIATPRWLKTSREVFGRSPTMKVLADVRMVNKMKETTIKAAQKATDPPLMAPDDGFLMPVTTVPGGVNYYRSGTSDRIEPIPIEGKVDFGFQLIDDTKKAIREGYYIDQLQLNQGGPQMTATEVDRRTEDAMRLLGPMLGRLQFEFLSPIVNRAWAILVRKGKIKIPPEIHAKLQKKKLMVQYSSLVARAQRTQEGSNLQRMVQAIAPFVQADPSIMDNVDGDKVFKYAADIYGVPAKLMKDAKAVKNVRDARSQAQQKMQQQQDQAHQADVAGKVLPAAAQAQMAQQQQKGRV